MSKKDFQNGFALGSIISGASEIKLLENTVTFLLNDKPYEIVGVKSGDSINPPATVPTSDNGDFKGWYDGDNAITFPYMPTTDISLTAKFGDE